MSDCFIIFLFKEKFKSYIICLSIEIDIARGLFAAAAQRESLTLYFVVVAI